MVAEIGRRRGDWLVVRLLSGVGFAHLNCRLGLTICWTLRLQLSSLPGDESEQRGHVGNFAKPRVGDATADHPITCSTR